MKLLDMPWRPMSDVPRNGKVVVVVYQEPSTRSQPVIMPVVVQFAQWNDGQLTGVQRKSSRPHADGWLTLAEFDKLINGGE